MNTFENFLNDCGVNDPMVLISFLEQFGEDFDPSSMPEKERAILVEAMDKILNKFII